MSAAFTPDPVFMVMGTAVTVTVQLAVSPPAEAVIVALPAATAVTTPFTTVATDVSLLVQVTEGSAALAGLTVATSVSVPPTDIDALVLFKLTPVTATGVAGVPPLPLVEPVPAGPLLAGVLPEEELPPLLGLLPLTGLLPEELGV